MTMKGPAAVATAAGEKNCQDYKIARKNSYNRKQQRSDRHLKRCAIARSKRPRQFRHSKGAVYKSTKKYAHVNPACPIQLEQHVVHKSNARDHNNDLPGCARIDKLPWIHKTSRRNASASLAGCSGHIFLASRVEGVPRCAS